MLTQEDPSASRPTRPTAPRAAWVAPFLLLLLVLVLVLRHDFWNWDTPYPLLFGFLPIGLWWQALVSILASIMMALFVRLAWPHHLEEELQPPPDQHK